MCFAAKVQMSNLNANANVMSDEMYDAIAAGYRIDAYYKQRARVKSVLPNLDGQTTEKPTETLDVQLKVDK